MPRVGEIPGIDGSDASRSLWSATAEVDEFPALEGDIEVDVAVVGAGITGVAVAYLLKREGKERGACRDASDRSGNDR